MPNLPKQLKFLGKSKEKGKAASHYSNRKYMKHCFANLSGNKGEMTKNVRCMYHACLIFCPGVPCSRPVIYAFFVGLHARPQKNAVLNQVPQLYLLAVVSAHVIQYHSSVTSQTNTHMHMHKRHMCVQWISKWLPWLHH